MGTGPAVAPVCARSSGRAPRSRERSLICSACASHFSATGAVGLRNGVLAIIAHLTWMGTILPQAR